MGKGDKPRNCFSDKFKDNYDKIFAKLETGINSMQEHRASPKEQQELEATKETMYKSKMAEIYESHDPKAPVIDMFYEYIFKKGKVFTYHG